MIATIRFDDDALAMLDAEHGWFCPGSTAVESLLNMAWRTLNTSPALGDAVKSHVEEMAARLNGTATMTPTTPAPADRVY